MLERKTIEQTVQEYGKGIAKMKTPKAHPHANLLLPNPNPNLNINLNPQTLQLHYLPNLIWAPAKCQRPRIYP